MPKKSRAAITKELGDLLAILQSVPQPVSYAEMRSAYEERTGRPIADSTLRKRLDELQNQRRVERDHRARTPRYWATHATEGPTRNAPGGELQKAQPDLPEFTIPLSDYGAKAQAALLRHSSTRQPTTYALHMLDDYRPRETWYVPEPLRSRLHALGHTTFAGQPAGTYANENMQRLVIDLSWGSSQLEGNRYTRVDTEDLLKGGKGAEGASARDRQMILNHKAAIEFLVENAQTIGFDRHALLSLHGLLAENLLDNADDEGRLRRRPVTIGTSLYTPTAVPQIIEERFDTMLAKAAAIPDAIEQSFFVTVHLPYLQPFIDVNKRTSRLAANISLIQQNLCPLSFVDVPEALYSQGMLAVYELRDWSLLLDVFAWAYERSCQQFKVLKEAMGEPDPIRLAYRVQLRALIADVVTEMVWPTAADLARRAGELGVPDVDLEAFARAARRDLIGLRPEVLARYHVRPSQYERWANAVVEKRTGQRH